MEKQGTRCYMNTEWRHVYKQDKKHNRKHLRGHYRKNAGERWSHKTKHIKFRKHTIKQSVDDSLQRMDHMSSRFRHMRARHILGCSAVSEHSTACMKCSVSPWRQTDEERWGGALVKTFTHKVIWHELKTQTHTHSNIDFYHSDIVPRPHTNEGWGWWKPVCGGTAHEKLDQQWAAARPAVMGLGGRRSVCGEGGEARG